MRQWIRLLTIVTGLLLALSGGAAVAVLAGRQRPAPRPAQVATPVPAGAATVTTPPISPATTSPAPTGIGPAVSAPATSTGPAPAALSAQASLGLRLDAAMAGTTGCLVVEDAQGRPLYQHQPDLSLVPASTQKLLVAAAALTTLGANFRFVTNVVAAAAPIGGQVPQLWLVGNGDPLLATPEFIATLTGRARVAAYPWTPLPALADGLTASGIVSVPGGIHGDDSHLDRLRFLPVWPVADQIEKDIGLLSALSLNEGIQTTTPTLTLAQDPPGFAASELARLLAARHVAVAPAAADQVAPSSGVVVASVSSAPLSQMVEAMLRASDNWIAELLVRQLDRAGGGTGTTAGGVAVILRDAATLGIPLSGVRMDDGSGLSHSDQATCRELLATLDLGRPPGLAPIMNGLAVAGSTGTLAGRYLNTPFAGRLAAKTGSIDNAGGMVGVLSAATTVRFALLINQVQPETALYAKEDRIVAALATWGVPN